MVKPHVVVFDLGKVLLDFDYGKVARSVAARSHLDEASVRRFIDQSPLLFRYETGLIDRETFYREICAETGFHGNETEFAAAFADIFEIMPAMVELHANLRAKGIPTYIFSNTSDLAIEHIRRTYPFFANFNGYIFSHEHQSMKPNAKLYEVVERETGKVREQILYIDDRAENIDAGAARGWQVILQETPEKTLKAIRQSGLLD